VSHGIVKDHDCWIEVDGPPEGGAVFRVFLPCAAGSAALAVPEPRPATEPAQAPAAAVADDASWDGARRPADVALAEADRIGKD